MGSDRPIVLLVHGTGAGDAGDTGERWWQSGSPFARAMAELFDDCDWQPPDRVFHWDGENSEASRRRAARDLATVFRGLEADRQPFHIVAHSHGGSVTWRALVESWNGPGSLPQLRSWTTMGTPFLHFSPDPPTLWWLLPVIAAAGVLYLAAGDARTMMTEASASLTEQPWPAHLLAGLWIAAALVILLAVLRLVWFAAARVRALRFERRAAAAYEELSRRHIALWSSDDEAINGLANTLDMHSEITPRLRTIGLPVIEGLVQNAIAPLIEVYNGLFAPAADDFIWSRIRRKLQGNDLPFMRLARVSTDPVGNPDGASALPADIGAPLLAHANEHAAKTVAAIRQALGVSASAGHDLPTFFIGVTTKLTWQELVHNGYYLSSGVQRRLAERLTGSAHRGNPNGALCRTSRRDARHLSMAASLAATAMLIGAGYLAEALAKTTVYPYTTEYQLAEVLRTAPVRDVYYSAMGEEPVLQWIDALIRANRHKEAVEAARVTNDLQILVPTAIRLERVRSPEAMNAWNLAGRETLPPRDDTPWDDALAQSDVFFAMGVGDRKAALNIALKKLDDYSLQPIVSSLVFQKEEEQLRAYLERARMELPMWEAKFIALARQLADAGLRREAEAVLGHVAGEALAPGDPETRYLDRLFAVSAHAELRVPNRALVAATLPHVPEGAPMHGLSTIADDVRYLAELAALAALSGDASAAAHAQRLLRERLAAGDALLRTWDAQLSAILRSPRLKEIAPNVQREEGGTAGLSQETVDTLRSIRKQNNLDAAADLIPVLGKAHRERDTLLTQLAIARVQASSVLAAERAGHLDRAERLAAEIADTMKQTTALIAIADASVERDPRRADRVLALLEKAIERERAPFNRTEALKAVARLHAQRGRARTARLVADRLTPVDRLTVYARIIDRHPLPPFPPADYVRIKNGAFVAGE